jgi:lysophospholipase L1-like esterase
MPIIARRSGPGGPSAALSLLLALALPGAAGAQRETGRSAAPAAARAPMRFECGTGRPTPRAVRLAPDAVYSAERAHGFLEPLASSSAVACASDRPFLFGVALPEGDYDVTVTLGDSAAATTTVKAEARRLMLEQLRTAPGQWVTRTFTVNVRTPRIAGSADSVRLKPREVGSATWDDRLTLEFNGSRPAVRSISVAPTRRRPPTVYLAGNSTVVDQTVEPYAAWGQMVPRFFRPGEVVVANHAESGETLRSFVGERRLAKVMSTIQPGDWLFVEFAHNDQKPGPSYVEPYTTYKAQLKRFVDAARAKGATPVLVTSTQRRTFGEDGRIVNTLGDYPAAMRQLAAEEQVALIDLTAMSTRFYEALGPERSKRALVHHPAGTYPGQTAELKDDTHFSNYGAYQLARMVVQGIRDARLPLARHLLPGLPPLDLALPDDPERFAVPASPPALTVKPAGS